MSDYLYFFLLPWEFRLVLTHSGTISICKHLSQQYQLAQLRFWDFFIYWILWFTGRNVTLPSWGEKSSAVPHPFPRLGFSPRSTNPASGLSYPPVYCDVSVHHAKSHACVCMRKSTNYVGGLEVFKHIRLLPQKAGVTGNFWDFSMKHLSPVCSFVAAHDLRGFVAGASGLHQVKDVLLDWKYVA